MHSYIESTCLHCFEEEDMMLVKNIISQRMAYEISQLLIDHEITEPLWMHVCDQIRFFHGDLQWDTNIETIKEAGNEIIRIPRQ